MGGGCGNGGLFGGDFCGLVRFYEGFLFLAFPADEQYADNYQGCADQLFCKDLIAQEKMGL